MKNKTRELYLIAHSHWDREWYKPFQQFRVHLVHLIDTIIEVCKSDPTYRHFNLDGQTIVVEDYLEIRPEMEQVLIELIKEKRIAIGPWYNQPDLWTSHELIARNLLKGDQLAKKYRGGQKVGYCPDLFGHCSQMPQIMRLIGVDNYIFERGLGNEMNSPDFSNEFWWEGPDGSRLLAYFMPGGGYANAKNHPDTQDEFNNFMLFSYSMLHNSKSHVYFIGCGGDHYIPQKSTPKLIQGFNEDDDVREELEGGMLHHATLSEFFQALKEREDTAHPYMVIKGEFRSGRSNVFEPGSISSRMYLKQANFNSTRKLCYLADPIVVWRAVDKVSWDPKGLVKLKPFIDLAWKYLLQNQPHDSMCGCSIDPVHREMENRFAQCNYIADEIIQEQLELFLIRQKEIPTDAQVAGAIPIVIFCPHPTKLTYQIKTWVSQSRNHYETDIIFAPEADFDVGYDVLLPSGEKISAYTQKARYKGAHTMLKVSWLVDFNGFGFYLFYLIPKNKEAPLLKPEPILTDYYENGWCKVKFSSNGSFDLTDKRSGLVYRNLHYLEDQADGGDGYDFYAIPGDKPITTLEASERTVGAKTPSGAVFTIRSVISLPGSLSEDRSKRSEIMRPQIVRSKIRIMDHTPTIEISTKLENQIKDHRLRAVFPTPLKSDKVAAGSIFDVVERGIGIEGQGPFDRWVQQAEPTSHTSNFIDVHQPTVGSMAVFNKGMPEYEARRFGGGVELIQTLFRSVAFEGGNLPTRGGAGSPIPTPEAQLLRPLSFDYAVHFHANDWKNDHIPNKANEYLIPTARAGGKIYVPGRRAEQFDIFDHYPRNLSSSQILLHASNSSVVFTSFKLADESQKENEIIIRLYNPSGEAANLDLNVGFSFSKVDIVNLLEEPIQDSPCKILTNSNEKVSLMLSKKAILTLKFTL